MVLGEGYQHAASRLDTVRLGLRPFATMDAASYLELIAEHGPGARVPAPQWSRRKKGLPAAPATGRERLWSTVGAWNAPSLRALEKTGFRRDHTDTDVTGGELVYLARDLP